MVIEEGEKEGEGGGGGGWREEQVVGWGERKSVNSVSCLFSNYWEAV